MLKSLVLGLLLATAQPRPYHIELIANPGAPFPFLSRFGTINLHIYPAGVRADTFWLNGFSRNGAPTVTVENPYGRMYTVGPRSGVTNIMRKMREEDRQSLVPQWI